MTTTPEAGPMDLPVMFGLTKNEAYTYLEVHNGQTVVTDRRVVERQTDGTVLMRDPVTKTAYTTSGNKLR